VGYVFRNADVKPTAAFTPENVDEVGLSGDAGPGLWKSDWLRGLDLNQRPPGYEPDELPGCSTPRLNNSGSAQQRQIDR
jgi:hypothetical protein